MLALTGMSHYRSHQIKVAQQKQEEEEERRLAEARARTEGALLAFEGLFPGSAEQLTREVEALLIMADFADSEELTERCFDASYAALLKAIRRWPELAPMASEVGLERARFRRGGLLTTEDRQEVSSEVDRHTPH